MKIYMIKNKEGKYYWYEEPCNDGFVKDLFLAEIFDNLDIAKKCVRDLDKSQDYEIVEGTFVEGDLENELAIRDKALELACKNIYSRSDGCITIVEKTGDNYGNVSNCPESEAAKYFLDQARKELEDKDDQ